MYLLIFLSLFVSSISLHFSLNSENDFERNEVDLSNTSWKDLSISKDDIEKKHVGLGKVSNKKLSNLTWNEIGLSKFEFSNSEINKEKLLSNSAGLYLYYNNYSNELNVNSGAIVNKVSSEKLGLGQVENEPQVSEKGDKVSGNLDFKGMYRIINVSDPVDPQDVATKSWVNENDDFEKDRYDEDTTIDGCDNCLEIGKEVIDTGGLKDGDDNTNTQIDEVGANNHIDMNGYRINYISSIYGSSNLNLHGPKNIKLFADGSSNSEISFFASESGLSEKQCHIDSNGLSCSGSKNWIHDLNSTHNAVYSAQESPQVRAVYEGQTNVSNGIVNVSLPGHFSGTVSDSRPSLRVQATPHSLANVAVTERTDDYLVIKADSQETVKVDYRVTGIREDYENKQVVRAKE